MPFKKIPQCEARSLKHQVKDLTRQLNAVKYRANLAEVTGTHLSKVVCTNADGWIVETAKRCRKIIVARPAAGENAINLYAVDP